MSAVDPSYVEQTKQQIRKLVAEIAQLSRQDLATGDFFRHFLTRVVDALAAPGGVVWMANDAGALELVYEINVRETRLLESEQAMQRHGQLLQNAMRAGEGVLAPPHSGDGEEGGAGNPTEFLLVLAPLKADQAPKGVIEVFQRAGAPPDTQRGYLRFLLQMCELASDYLKTRQLRHYSDRQTLWNQLENFTRVAHRSLDPREAAYTIANEGRRLIECDRVSVAIRRGRKCVIEAVSGQDMFDKRSNTVSLLSRLASAVVKTGDALWYSGDTADLAPQVEQAVQEYVDESHSKNVAVLPLKRPLPAGEDSPEGKTGETIGALIVELIEDAKPPEGMIHRVNVVCEHSSTALANALEHNNLFLMPVWKKLGKARWLVQARTLPKTVAVIVAATVVIAAACLVPWDFDLKATGTLEPVSRRDVFAQVVGQVKAVRVREGDKVKANETVLVELESHDLEKSIVEVERSIATTDSALVGIKGKRRRADAFGGRNRPPSGESPEELAAKENELEKELIWLEKQRDVLKRQEERLVIRSPIDGTVVSWDIENRLLNQTVRPGQVLMEIRDLEGDYELHLRMPEQDMGHVVQARHDLEPALPVEYILAVNPGEPLHGAIAEVDEAAEVHGEEGNTVRIKVRIDTVNIHWTHKRPGAEATAKVHCGRRAVGYVLLHRVFEFVESRILFRIW